MHLDYRGDTQCKAIISTGLTTMHYSLHCNTKKRLVLLYSDAMWHFSYSHLQRLRVYVFFLSAFEWHGILLACWSVVNSNGNGLVGRRESRGNLRITRKERYGNESGFWVTAVPPPQIKSSPPHVSFLSSVLSRIQYLSFPFLSLLLLHPTSLLPCLSSVLSLLMSSRIYK